MIVKYRTRWDQIERIECERETKSSVFINGQRQAKTSSYESFHDSWEAAHAFLFDKQRLLVERLRRQLEVANGKLGNIKGMKPPKDAK